ncbi:MAG: hypothetical protein ABSH09_29660 [Bryobacteraceae bacterium]|jgi:hypothetical protein
MNWFFRIVASAAMLTGVAAYAQSQLFCEAGAITPPGTARAEGTTELINDMLLVCTGGTPTPPGQPVPVVNVTLSLNTNITNRLLGGGFMDALLLIDEPYPATPIVPPNTGVSTSFNPAQALCYSTAIAAPGSCNYLPGNGGGGYQYSSSPYLQPNAFTIYAAQQNAANQVTWYGVPIDPPGNDLRVMRMTNLRANANLIGAHVTSADIVATVAVSDSSDTILSPQQTVASTVMGMRFNNSPVTLCGCVSHNASLVGGSGTTAFDGSIQVIDIFANAMRRRNIGLSVDGPTPPLAYPQNVPGFGYPYETGFVPSPVAVSPPGYTLEPADSGARFVLSFSNVPAGVQVFLPVSVTARHSRNQTLMASPVPV